MATLNEANRNAPTEERAPSDRRADIGPRKAGVWAIAIGVFVLGVVLVALEFAGRAQREPNQPADDNATRSPAAR